MTGHRRFADYEYSVDGQTLRVERYSDGWRWLVFWADGRIETQTDAGDYSTLKREAKADGTAYINQEGA